MFRRIKVSLVSVLLIGAAIYLASVPVAPPQQPAKNPRNQLLGFLEHRGKRYWLSDLFDPAYRAACDDPFVRQFDEGLKIADGSERNDQISLNQANRGELHPIPWAGRGPGSRAEWDLWAGSDP